MQAAIGRSVAAMSVSAGRWDVKLLAPLHRSRARMLTGCAMLARCGSLRLMPQLQEMLAEKTGVHKASFAHLSSRHARCRPLLTAAVALAVTVAQVAR